MPDRGSSRNQVVRGTKRLGGIVSGIGERHVSSRVHSGKRRLADGFLTRAFVVSSRGFFAFRTLSLHDEKVEWNFQFESLCSTASTTVDANRRGPRVVHAHHHTDPLNRIAWHSCPSNEAPLPDAHDSESARSRVVSK